MKSTPLLATLASLATALSIWNFSSVENDTPHSPQDLHREQSLGQFSLQLPSGLPPRFAVEIPHDDSLLKVQFQKHNVLGENTRFISINEAGKVTELPIGEDRFYLGQVPGRSDILVNAHLSDEGLVATIFRAEGEDLRILPMGNARHEIFSLENKDHLATADPNSCAHFPVEFQGGEFVEEAASLGAIRNSFPFLLTSVTQANVSTATLRPNRVLDVLEYEVGVEIGSAAFLNNYSGSTAQKRAQAMSVAMGIPANMDARYLHSAGIKHRLGTVVIRESSADRPYDPPSNGNDVGGLTRFRNYWNNNANVVGNTHDLAVYHVRSSPSGLASVNGAASNFKYALSASNGPTSWADGTVAHEFGHLWNLRHTNDGPINNYDYNSSGPLPGQFYESRPRDNSGSSSSGGPHRFITIMNGSGTHNIGRLSTDEAATVFGRRQAKRGAGTPVNTNNLPIRPFGHRDIAVTSGNPITIDVIANDYDFNNDVLDAVLLDTRSHRGGAISLSKGTGLGGRNEVIYTPPANLSGVDFFHYTVCDSTGRSDWGCVYVSVEGPTLIDLNQAAYFYDIGTVSSPLFTGGADTYENISDITFGEIGFSSDGPNFVESRDRGSVDGVNSLNQDLIRMRSPGNFKHKLAPGIYNLLFTVGDAVESTGAIRLTAEGDKSVTTSAQPSASFKNFTIDDVSVSDGELNVEIENLGFSSNITRIVIRKSGSVVDPTAISFVYDAGPAGSPLQNGATALTPDLSSGDVFWSGASVGGRDRGSDAGNGFNRDFILGSGTSTLNHKLSNGTWSILMNMGDNNKARDRMQLKAEGQIISNNITSPAGQYSYVSESGGTSSPAGFQVEVTDGELNLEFSDRGGSDPEWVVNRIVIRKEDGDSDEDGYSDFLELAAGTDSGDPQSRPILSTRALSAHWPLNESSGSTAADASGSNQTATWAGGSGENSWVGGLMGRAAQINDENGGNGSEHFRANLTSLNGASRFSLSLWFNQNVDNNNNSNYNGLLMTREMRSSLGDGGGENWGIALEGGMTARHIDWRVEGGPGPEVDNIEGNVVDEWQHVLYVWDGVAGMVHLYQNGELINSRTTATGTITTGGEWRIGDDACCGNREFTGSLDDISVFTEALTANDAALIYNAGQGGFSVDNLIGPEAEAPTLTTGAATSITQTSATISYTVTDDGNEAPAVTLYYGETNGGATAGNWSNDEVLGTQSTGPQTTSITGLTPGTTYFYNIFGSNSGGDDWGSPASFTTTGNYNAWATTNNVISGANGDDDNDGIKNLMEYALGLDPKSADANPGTFIDNELTFAKSSEAVSNGDLTYLIEISSNLKDPWIEVIPDTNTASVINYTLPADEGVIFARLRVIQN